MAVAINAEQFVKKLKTSCSPDDLRKIQLYLKTEVLWHL